MMGIHPEPSGHQGFILIATNAKSSNFFEKVGLWCIQLHPILDASTFWTAEPQQYAKTTQTHISTWSGKHGEKDFWYEKFHIRSWATISHLRTYSVIDLFEPLKKATAKRLCADIKIEYWQQKFRFEIIDYYRPPPICGPNLSSIGPSWRILRSFEIWRLE